MPNLCALCGSQVSYFGRRFARHRWFCSRDCLTRWETETQHAEHAPYSGATEHRRLSRGLLIIGVIAALVVAYFVMAGVATWAHDGMAGVSAGIWTLVLLVGAWIAYLDQRRRGK